MRLVITDDPAPAVLQTNEAAAGSLGGGGTQRLASPIEVKVVTQDIPSGGDVAVPDPLRPREVFVALPILPTPAPASGSSAAAATSGEFAWLMEVR